MPLCKGVFKRCPYGSETIPNHQFYCWRCLNESMDFINFDNTERVIVRKICTNNKIN